MGLLSGSLLITLTLTLLWGHRSAVLSSQLCTLRLLPWLWCSRLTLGCTGLLLLLRDDVDRVDGAPRGYAVILGLYNGLTCE